jgi:hypothetical protein
MDRSVKQAPEQTRRVKTGRGVSQGCCVSPILSSLYSKYLAKRALEGFGGFRLGGQAVHTLLVLMAKEEVLQRLSETGRCCGMEMNVIRAKMMRM